MRAPQTPKVCFPVAGKPAIAHLLESQMELGLEPTILVVGHLAGTVVGEVGPQFPHVLFAYQSELLGTGHATRQGAAVLLKLGFDGAVLVTAGDKVVEPRALRKLIREFETRSPDLALLVAQKCHWPSGGRIVADEQGRVLRIIEQADLLSAQAAGSAITVGDRSFTASEIEARSECVNQAVYLFRAPALFEALATLEQDNVQREEYLTDTVDYLVRRGRLVLPVPVDDPDDVLGFNTPSELLRIEEHFRKQPVLVTAEPLSPSPRIFKPPAEWARRLSDPDATMRDLLRSVYGDDASLCDEKCIRLREAVALFIERFGSNGRVAVIRAPGRINLMGRHVDHRGGRVNLMAIDREHIVVARARDDSAVRARNADPGQFNDMEFTVDDLVRQIPLDDWRGFVNSDVIVKMVRDLRGDWGNYLKAAMLRLQQEFKDRRILGLDCLVSGDIPVAAGLSSSSALVVAMAEALVLSNRLEVAPRSFVSLCGEGEWFVGTRGGSADHAAIKLSRSGCVAHVGFFPFAVHGYAPFPEGNSLVICNSRVQARKSAGALDAFNERVASYEIAVRLVQKRFPNYAPLVEHLRDICPEQLGVRAADIYRLLLKIPETITPDELRTELGRDTYEEIASTHRPVTSYSPRARLLFGIAECERSKLCFRLLQQGEMVGLGRYMNISHDGDRIVTADGRQFTAAVCDEVLRARIDDLQSQDPDRVARAQLCMQRGAYACSLPEIDRMVDIALATPGVLGAQLSGAGLGGCMMVLTREEAAASVIRRLNELYYQPQGLDPSAMVITPIAGCGPLAVHD